jgi:hypothetical protein
MANYNTGRSLSLLQQLRQLGDVSRDPPRLVLGEQFDGGSGYLNVPIR